MEFVHEVERMEDDLVLGAGCSVVLHGDPCSMRPRG